MVDGKREELRPEDAVPRLRTPFEVERAMANNNSFRGQLYRLMDKADRNNFFKLQKGFPQEAQEYINWLHHTEKSR